MQVLSLGQEDPMEEGMAYWSDLACHARFRKVKQLVLSSIKFRVFLLFMLPLYVVKYYMTKGQVLLFLPISF